MNDDRTIFAGHKPIMTHVLVFKLKGGGRDVIVQGPLGAGPPGAEDGDQKRATGER